MAENQILPFAYADGANVLSQSDYQADNQRLIGHQPGIARSALENKALRQASTIAAGLAQFIADGQTSAVTDSLTPAQIADMLKLANAAAFKGSANVLLNTNGFQKLPSGLILQWGTGKTAANGEAVVTYPLANTAFCVPVVTAASGTGSDPIVATIMARTENNFTVATKRTATGNLGASLFCWVAAGV